MEIKIHHILGGNSTIIVFLNIHIKNALYHYNEFSSVQYIGMVQYSTVALRELGWWSIFHIHFRLLWYYWYLKKDGKWKKSILSYMYREINIQRE